MSRDRVAALDCVGRDVRRSYNGAVGGTVREVSRSRLTPLLQRRDALPAARPTAAATHVIRKSKTFEPVPMSLRYRSV